MRTIIKKIILNFLPGKMIGAIKKLHYYHMFRSVVEGTEKELKIIKHLVCCGDHVIDIGANIGVYTKFLSELVGMNGCAYSIEPVQGTYEILSSNVRIAKLGNVKLFNCAISDCDGFATMTIPLGKDGIENYYRASIKKEENINNSLKKVRVKTNTIDSLFSKDIQKISFIKCDAEGHELSCIRGALKTINNSKPALFIEVHGSPDIPDSESYMLFKELQKVGYDAYIFDGEKLHKRRENQKGVNYFFLTHEHVNNLKEGIVE